MNFGGRRFSPAAAVAAMALTVGVVEPTRLAAQSGYGGPNILSRSAGYQGRGAGPQPLKLRASLNSNFFRTDGALGFDSGGRLVNGASDGLSGGFSLYGVRVQRRSQTTFGYSGAYNYVRNLGALSGVDQTLVLQHEQQLTRRWGFYTGHHAGTQASVLRARTVGQLNQFRSNFDEAYVNYYEPVDTHLKFINSNAGFYYQKSSRLAFSMDGGLFTVRRRGTGLASANGERAQGEASYRLGPKSNISVLYNYNHFFFLNSFGESFMHGMQLSYGRRIDRIWSIYLRGGPYRVESERLRSVRVDPFVAQLIGQATTIEAFHAISNGVSAGGGLTGQGRRHGVNFVYDRSVNPGNGLTLTAMGQSATAYYNYQGLRKASLGGGFFYSALTPLLTGVVESGRNSGDFGAIGGGGGFAYRLSGPLHLMGNVEVARVRYSSTSFNTTRRTASIGVAFSPGELPLRWR